VSPEAAHDLMDLCKRLTGARGLGLGGGAEHPRGCWGAAKGSEERGPREYFLLFSPAPSLLGFRGCILQGSLGHSLLFTQSGLRRIWREGACIFNRQNAIRLHPTVTPHPHVKAVRP